MNITPMHKIEIIHSWKEVNRIWTEGGSATIVEQCQDCDTERRVLRLSRESGPSLEESAPAELSASLEHISVQREKIARAMREMLQEMLEQLIHDGDYDSINDFIRKIKREIKNRSQGVVDGSTVRNELPISQLEQWIHRPKMYKLQSLLEFFQGPVCNRCERVFSHTVRPTLDHINGDRNNYHPSNLQLLCEPCNNVDKGKNPPDGRDISPFTYNGPSCEHRLTCVELRAFQMDGENAEEELP